MTWERTFSNMRVVHRHAYADTAVARQIAQETCGSVTQALREAGWTKRDLKHPSAPHIMLRVAEHADFWARNQVAILAEARALDLRTADPLPPAMPLWTRRSRVR